MLALPIVDSPLSVERVEQAVALFRLARRHGLTVRSSIDCLIAASALHHDLEVIHADRDFDVIASVSGLRTTNVGR
jgi:predicted nucleic acid-binding protein